MVQALVGQVLAVAAVLLWLPSGFGGLTTLRYDIVRLVVRTFDFWFFSTVTSVIVITVTMYLSDLRWVRMLNGWFGFHHVIFIDAHILGLRNLTYILIFGYLKGFTSSENDFDKEKTKRHQPVPNYVYP
ncbi:hypothetical protein V7S43_000594 [Phytophthora oleae]|uniref:Uncharacterized protein n=1 Tax=Phytophthora oleae TaxID=2107226 RepID=A0ABD3G871_9STRA